MRVLVVEDEDVMSEAVATGLRRSGMAVDVAADGEAALEKVAVTRYDVVVLDRDIPRVHGDDVCRHICTSGQLTRVLMLTASGTLDDRVDGLSLGADDYLAKPFAFAELVARVQALGRRAHPLAPPALQWGDVCIVTARRTATRADRDLGLSAKELGVLEVLVGADGRVVSAEELLDRVWDELADPFTNAVRVTLVGLRRKLGDPPIIETVRGAGYRLAEASH